MEYLIPLLLTIVGIIMNSRFRKEGPKLVILGLIFVYVVLLMGFRYRVGMDTISYMDIYKDVPALDDLTSNDLGRTLEAGRSAAWCLLPRSHR